jgi:hypothetical protein
MERTCYIGSDGKVAEEDAEEEAGMYKELSDQLQDLIDALQVAESHARQLAQSLRESGLDVDLDHHAEIKHLISKAQQLRQLAEEEG